MKEEGRDRGRGQRYHPHEKKIVKNAEDRVSPCAANPDDHRHVKRPRGIREREDHEHGSREGENPSVGLEDERQEP